MFLSIIIPVYNTEKYLHECIQSCVDQDIDSNDYEIICVNDGSKDKSLSILKEYELNYKNITVIEQQNSGVSIARNKGISVAKGDYIWFVDSDDFIETNCLGKLKEIASNNYDLITFGAYSFAETISKEKRELLKTKDLKNDPDFYYGANFSQLYKLSLVNSYNVRYRKDIAYGEDTLFSHELNTVVKNRKNLTDIFYFYRKNPESAMNSLQQTKKRLIYMNSTISIIEILKSGLEDGRFTKESSEGFIQFNYKNFLMMLVRLSVKDANKFFNTMCSKGLLEKNFLKKYSLPKKNKIIFAYITKHFKIWIRSFLRRKLPKRIVLLFQKP